MQNRIESASNLGDSGYSNGAMSHDIMLTEVVPVSYSRDQHEKREADGSFCNNVISNGPKKVTARAGSSHVSQRYYNIAATRIDTNTTTRTSYRAVLQVEIS